MQKRCRAEAQAGLKPAWAPVQVLVDLCLKEDTLEQTLCYLLKKAKQEEPAAPVLPEAENLHHAHAEHQGDPEGGAAGLRPGPGSELHLEAGHAGQVLVDLCLKEDILDQALCYLLKKAKQKRSLLHLCCQKLKIITMPMQSIRGILKVVQLDSVQDLEVNCTWKLATLSRFVPHLGWMGNLCWLLLWHIHLLPYTDPDKEEYCVSQLTA
ncbi:hypothetical protein E5288_WYG008336 [Bos mutus]|uniref:Uncharacterized protein n=1 Tax=Bos mutus TaxID=72004 RepID=A0A6B0SFW0_9CETA|nr:hypothetical protein [Bos mutus]